MTKCSSCSTNQPDSNFDVRHNGKQYLTCCKCRAKADSPKAKARRKAYHEQHRESLNARAREKYANSLGDSSTVNKLKQKNREYRLSHIEDIKLYARKAAAIRHESARQARLSGDKSAGAKYLWQIAKARAKERGVPFSIEPSDIVIPDTCPILNIPLVFHTGIKGGDVDSPTLDRIVPELGYVKGNIGVMSLRANAIKNCFGVNVFKAIVEYILKGGAN